VTAPTITSQSAPDSRDSNWDDEMLHYFCCDPDWALCGESLDGHRVCDCEDDHDVICPMCALIDEDGCPRCGE
jgi:hypothetical protein